jgi:acyl-homoserine lactone acylase PvdQ
MELDDFREALKSFGSPAQNFVYGDVDGNIGWMGLPTAGGGHCRMRGR